MTDAAANEGIMANHRIYQYTSLGRPPDLSASAARAVVYLLPAVALLGAVMGWLRTGDVSGALYSALVYALALYGSWALARELDPDDSPAAIISLAAGVLAVLLVEAPGILIVFVVLGLVRMVNRSSGLPAKRSDSFSLMVLSIFLIYTNEAPLFGAVAALAFFLDGSLRDPLRSQWVYGLVCLGGMVVYMVDHDVGLQLLAAPQSLFQWLSLLFILIFALDSFLLKRVKTRGDVNSLRLDVSRVRGGMAVAFLAALQGLNHPQKVVIIVATIAGLCIGMAFRKSFKAPVA